MQNQTAQISKQYTEPNCTNKKNTQIHQCTLSTIPTLQPQNNSTQHNTTQFNQSDTWDMLAENDQASDEVEVDDAAMCITNQSIYYFMTPRCHDHNEMFQDDICDAYEWFQVMISSQSIIQKDPYNVMSRQSPGSRTAVRGELLITLCHKSFALQRWLALSFHKFTRKTSFVWDQNQVISISLFL